MNPLQTRSDTFEQHTAAPAGTDERLSALVRAIAVEERRALLEVMLTRRQRALGSPLTWTDADRSGRGSAVALHDVGISAASQLGDVGTGNLIRRSLILISPRTKARFLVRTAAIGTDTHRRALAPAGRSFVRSGNADRRPLLRHPPACQGPVLSPGVWFLVHHLAVNRVPAYSTTSPSTNIRVGVHLAVPSEVAMSCCQGP